LKFGWPVQLATTQIPQRSLQMSPPVPPAQSGSPVQGVPTATHPSSVRVSQSSSQPLPQISVGAQQVPSVHVAEQSVVPAAPQVLVQATPVAFRRHANPLSATVSQSSSAPLHASAGGTQVPHVQPDTHVWLPVLEHDVVQFRVAPSAQVNPLSITVSQSSSIPLHTSVAVAVHDPQAQLAPQVRVPAHPPTVQEPAWPGVHGKSSSTSVSQSSSRPLQVSAVVTVHSPQAQVSPQVRVPEQVRPPAPVRVQADVAPRTQENVSSVKVSQSSSSPLHTSTAVAMHAP
jgi:hypothetical protein